jgi:pyruvate formate-lyase activating enzyme-like uncharacterized protein
MVEETKWHSYCTGKLAKGCAMCVQGRKLVLFITGLCGQKCWYCPVSEHKFGSDVVYANEWKLANPDDPKELIKEAELTGARGAGITGGDPLVKMDRCIQYIKLLKEKFGKNFHIHLYTPLQLVTEERMKALYEAGLDEIRLHPHVHDQSWWERINIPLKYNWDVGIEIPAVPGKEEETKKLIDYVAGKVKFINLNELERSDTKAEHYKIDEKGYEAKDEISYGVSGSKEMALKMIAYAETKGLAAHFCTAKLKDSVQMAQRIKIRAGNVAKSFDETTEEGLLLRGVCYLPGLQPGIDFDKRIAAANKEEAYAKLKEASEKLEFETAIDKKKIRLLMSRANAKEHAEELQQKGLIPAIVEEYPTADAIEVDIEFV